MSRTDARRDRVLAVSLLVAALMLVYLLFVHWPLVMPHLALRDELIALRDQEASLRATAAQQPALQARLAEVAEAELRNPGFLAEESFDLATAGLMQRLESVVAASTTDSDRCQVVNKTPYKSREKERFERVTVKVRMRCEVEEFSNVLHEIEGGSPQLFVGDVNMISRRPTFNRRINQAPQRGYLDISFDLYGYLHQRSDADG
ncbi:MAG: general secretion pathway protein GspM [Rhodanobacteraceae bacterium]|nr:general secretion pathway protein GspM [Xanthomonadales bacterium]MCP5479494.1 general secretion pathway protein GspM [Rhodanobacteraceae bacterium]HPF73850.1 type II secretion system protein GspM [Xanthomonadaceae bacterium]HRY00134.1 type II secretion system protein GspM [Xanthomonadaceae bacterium]